MGSTIRFPSEVLRGKGEFWQRFPGLPVGDGSTVMASICEVNLSPTGPHPVGGLSGGDKHPRMFVKNVVPQDGTTVDALINIDSDTEVNYRVNFLISNDAG